MNTKLLLCSSLLLLCITTLFAQNSQSDSTKQNPEKHKVIANIFTEVYYGLNDNVQPRVSFHVSRGLFGYTYNYNDKLAAILIYDVTRTTRDIVVRDTAGNILEVEYRAGSKYTGFLKLAEIDYRVNKWLHIAFGQLMTSQYTILRNYWGYAYICHTFQEKYNLGMPADFGTIITFTPFKNFDYSFSVFNGEGPFQYQADNKLIVANNIQYKAFDKLYIKIYHDYNAPPDTENGKVPRSAFSAYVGYLGKRFKLGAEYALVSNEGFNEAVDYEGGSVHTTFVFNPKHEILARYDYLADAPGYHDNHIIIVGYQYTPLPKLNVAVNFRQLYPDNKPQLYLNLGIKF